MYEEKDYIMRLVHEMIRTLIKLIFGIGINRWEDVQVPEETKERYLRWRRMIDDGKINEAENLLLDNLDVNDRKEFELALLFYAHLNQKEDAFLEEHRFSREEVMEGVKYVVNLYGYGGMMEAFTEDFE